MGWFIQPKSTVKPAHTYYASNSYLPLSSNVMPKTIQPQRPVYYALISLSH